MKLLLTSDGPTTQPIQEALSELAGKPFGALKFVCITTAINRDGGDKTKKIKRIAGLHALGFAQFDLVDVAAIERQYWLPRLEDSDVIFVLGGNTYYLLDEVRKSGLANELPKLLETRVYVGDSAGSILVTPSIDVAEIDDGDENIVGIKDTSGLGLVEFEVSPHTPEDVSLKANEDYAKTIDNKLVAYDNNMAIKVDNNKIEMVGDGKYWEYNK